MPDFDTVSRTLDVPEKAQIHRNPPTDQPPKESILWPAFQHFTVTTVTVKCFRHHAGELGGGGAVTLLQRGFSLEKSGELGGPAC